MSEWIGMPDNLNESLHHSIIYRTTNLITNKKYIGKKLLWTTTKRPPLKGYKRKRLITKPSDYLTYYGSSEELKTEILLIGKENYKREVLEVCSCKWEASFLELMWQLKENVIITDNYHNGILNLRIPKIPKHLQDKYKNFKCNFTFELTKTISFDNNN